MSIHRLSRALLLLILALLVWTFVIALTGGFVLEAGPIRLSSRNYQNTIRAALVSAVALSALLLVSRPVRPSSDQPASSGPPAAPSGRSRALTLARGAVALGVVGSYFSYVFQLSSGTFLQAGLGDWVDPYFINFILEHWYYALTHFSDPASPPMYFAAPGTLGYSHGLILYAPFYVAARLFLHPFPAYTVALLLAFVTGSLSLYFVLRRFLRLGFVESLLLSVLFFTSRNVMSAGTGVWSQWASVFAIPPMAAIALTSIRMPAGRAAFSLAWLSGLLSTLLFTQDFYSGQLAWFCAAVLLLPTALVLSPQPSVRAAVTAVWRNHGPWLRAFALGAFVGGLVFLEIYLRSFLEHPTFPESDLINAMVASDPSSWHSPLDFLRDLSSNVSMRSFKLVFLLAILVWMPWFGADRPSRLAWLWFVVVSVLVLVLPLRFGDFSIWKTFIAPLPGFASIRDPKRIIHIYELFLVLVLGLLLTRLPRRSLLRIGASVAIAFLLYTERNRDVLDYLRPVSVYEQWVEAPIAMDPACRSFFIKGASEAYMARSTHMWTLYNIDAMFVSLKHGLPTLNGYSAWWPDGWLLANPQEDTYLERVNGWINQQGLHDVCAFDIEARRMTPYQAPRR